jgi:transcriptional regulator with XRE-family HTH domain
MDLKQQAEAFAKWLKSQMDEKEFRFAVDLARISGVSAQAISGMLAPRPSPNTNKYQVPRRDTLIKIARALGADKDEALKAAGYLPIIEDDSEIVLLFHLPRGTRTPVQITDPEILAATRKAIADKLKTE